MYNTKSKELLYNFFILNKEKKYTGNDLIDIFSDEMDKSTIYRQLKKLEDNKFLRKSFNTNKNIYEYQYYNTINDNLHLTCSKCGKTINLNCKVANDFVAHILNDHDFNIDNYSSTIYGICKECE